MSSNPKFFKTKVGRYRFKWTNEHGKSIIQSSTAYATHEEAVAAWNTVELFVTEPIRDELETAADQVKDLDAKLKATRSLVTETGGELHTAKKARDALDREVMNLRSNLDQCKAKIAELEGSTQRLTRALDEARNDKLKLKNVLKAKDRTIETLQQVRDAYVAQVEDLEAALAEAGRTLWQRLLRRK